MGLPPFNFFGQTQEDVGAKKRKKGKGSQDNGPLWSAYQEFLRPAILLAQNPLTEAHYCTM
jgi:hypothetical protein